jgi:WD40 repeat protein
MGLTTTPDHDMIVVGGNDNVVSFWDAEAGPHTPIASSARSNGRIASLFCSIPVRYARLITWQTNF